MNECNIIIQIEYKNDDYNANDISDAWIIKS